MAGPEIHRLADADHEGSEGWGRLVDDELRYVDAIRYDDLSGWPWYVTVAVAEFLREDPLEGELHAGIDQALRAVPGVLEVDKDDREIWLVAGDASGEDLVRAAATVVDALADRARAYLDEEI